MAAVVALAAVLTACGSSSGSSSSEGTSAEPTASTGEEVEGSEEEQFSTEEVAEGESELEHIMRIQIYGKFGGTANEFPLLEGGSCKIVKINTTPAEIKAGGASAILDHEKTASVVVVPAKGKATAAHCREAVESAIG